MRERGGGGRADGSTSRDAEHGTRYCTRPQGGTNHGSLCGCTRLPALDAGCSSTGTTRSLRFQYASDSAGCQPGCARRCGPHHAGQTAVL